MGYALFSQAREWVADGSGECTPEKLAKVVNTIRHHLYLWYQDLPLFLDAIECFAVQRFCMDCNACQDSYRGVTLPRDFQTVEAMWWNDYPVRLQSSWREYQTGLTPECDCKLQKFDLPGSFSTALDILPDRPVKLQVRCFDPNDEGRRFVIRGTDVFGRPSSQEFKLSTNVQETNVDLRSVNGAGGIIKESTAGRVVLSDTTGRILGMYEPDETLPTYKRIKITGLPDNCEAVNIRAARRYFPLTGDDDVVETDNSVAFDAMARYLRLYKKSDKSRDDLVVEKDHYATARALVLGERSREVGKATQAEVKILTPRIGGGGLNRLGRRF